MKCGMGSLSISNASVTAPPPIRPTERFCALAEIRKNVKTPKRRSIPTAWHAEGHALRRIESTASMKHGCEESSHPCYTACFYFVDALSAGVLIYRLANVRNVGQLGPSVCPLLC